MASVQELIAAAREKAPQPSPLLQLLDSGIKGYQTGQEIRSKNEEIASRIIQQQRIKQEMQLAQAVEQRKAARRALEEQGNAAVQDSLRNSAVKPAGVLPVQKITKVIDEEGNPTTTTSYGDDPEKLEALLVDQVRSGKIPLADAIRLKNTSGGGVISPPTGYRFTSSGSLEAIPGGPAESKQTDSQANANLFGTRAEEANSQIEHLMNGGYNPASITTVRDKLPGWMGGNFISTPEGQQYKQAKTNFMTAVLRKESGATIQPSEFATADAQYFPVAGDSPEVIAQKRQNRETAMRLIKAGSKNGASSLNQSSSGVLKEGAVDSGYIFKGGDPADPKNWEKQ